MKLESEMTQMMMLMLGMQREVEKREGLELVLDAICAYMEMSRSCKDSAGQELRAGDVLTGGTLTEKCGAHDEDETCPHDKQNRKRVLEIGWRWAVLSQCYEQSTDADAQKDDGRWYEATIKDRKWVKI